MPINHVILLMLENRSFDHMLGDLRGAIPGLDGIDPANPGSNIYDGVTYYQGAGAARFVKPDPVHEYVNVRKQIKNNNGGFVADYADSNPHASDLQRQEVMRYHAHGRLNVLHTLAEHFLVCDHWYASVPGPTWPNRLFAMSGTSLGRVTMPQGAFHLNLHWYDQATIFDRLNEKDKCWKVYYTDFALSFLLTNQWAPRNVARHKHMTTFFRDAARDPAKFPAFAFIEPAYMEPGPTDGHPPHDIYGPERLIANVYNAIRRNEALWNETLLVLLWDEHGGFYDHELVVPATPPDDHHGDNFGFDTTGLRVPAILISPLVNKGVLHTRFDHTSLLKFLVDKWALGGLGKRTETANTFASSLIQAPRADTPSSVTVEVPANVASELPPVIETLSSGQSAMVALSQVLESMSGDDAATIASRGKSMLSNPQSHLDVASDRLESFVETMSAKA